MSNHIDGAAQHISTSGPALTDEFHNFIADIEDLLKTTTSLTGAEFEQAKKKLTERVATAKASVEGIGQNFAAKARHSAEVTDRYVHQQPWQSIAVCAATSFVLGAFIARYSGTAAK
ncbi:DUF883 domain-containing protein [Rheinheimera sediminis]|uniref:DUF883 family protein n=1 Tax=Rheinheimera sp. YQF-1 TaxID=2499626 RepID=UPI000FDC2336|nr:DUF883 family protein [Rheinheimera sp. YQF-1]RVT44864.1 DUF883 domain-containing protein [Rheinheimera sp. YQF-1]